MKFNLRTSDYSQAGKAAADDFVRSFAAARRNSPDFGKMAQEAASLRSKKKIEGINAAADVTQYGIRAASEVQSTKITESAKRSRDSAKRKAGALATAGKLVGQAGTLYGDSKDIKLRDTSDSQYQTGRMTSAQEELEKATKALETFNSGVNPETGKSYSTPPSGSTPTQTGGESGSENSGGGTNAGSTSPSPTPKKVTATGSRADNFNTIYDLAKADGRFKFPEVVAAQAMHETGWMNPDIKSVYNSTGGTNPFGQTGDRGYGTIPREGFKDGWTIYPDLKTAVGDHYSLWHDTANHAENYNAFDDRTTAIRTVASAYSPNSDKDNIRLGYTENGYLKGVNSALAEMGL